LLLGSDDAGRVDWEGCGEGFRQAYQASACGFLILPTCPREIALNQSEITRAKTRWDFDVVGVSYRVIGKTSESFPTSGLK
jgi:hypothetical protein